jgi:hypothetical protein
MNRTGKAETARRQRSRRNPLWWGVFAAIGALLPAYRFRDFLDLLLPSWAVAFLVVYFLRSKFAWHILAANAVVITPFYVFLSPSWRLQLALNPNIIWLPIVGTCLFALVVWWSRRGYFTYLEQQKKGAADDNISNETTIRGRS